MTDTTPFYKQCADCIHYQYTDESLKHTKEQKRLGYQAAMAKACTRYPTQTFPRPDYSCGEWTCKRCWSPWDMVEIGDLENPVPTVIDHTQCEPVNLNTLVDDGKGEM